MKGTDLNALAKELFAAKSIEETQVDPAATSTVYATALGDSEEGTVLVNLGDDVTTPDEDVLGEDAATTSVELPTTQAVKEGDSVLVTVTNGHPVVTGVVGSGDATDAKATQAQEDAEAAKDAATAAETAAEEAKQAAAATSQHFWYDDNGCHVSTDEAQAEGTRNALWNSEGLLFREGANNNASITGGAVAFYDGEGNDAANVTAAFGTSNATIGKTSEQHVELDSDGLELYDGEGQRLASIGKSTVTLGEQDHLAQIEMMAGRLVVDSSDVGGSGDQFSANMYTGGQLQIKGSENVAVLAGTTKDISTSTAGTKQALTNAFVDLSNAEDDAGAPRAELTSVYHTRIESPSVGDPTELAEHRSSIKLTNSSIKSTFSDEDYQTETTTASNLTQTTDSLVFDKTICATGGASTAKTVLTNVNRDTTGTAGMYMNWASPTATGAPTFNSRQFHVLGFEGYNASVGYDMQMAQAGFGDAALAVRSQSAGTWGDWNYCVLATQKLKVFAGTLVKTATASDSLLIWTAAQIKSTFGVDYYRGGLSVAFTNATADLQSVHIEGASMLPAGVYAVFNKNALAGAIRINYIVIFFSGI